MAKAKAKNPHESVVKTKEPKDKGKEYLVGRVKKVIKKSRRKLGEEKFEKELLRTIEFLGQLQVKIHNLHESEVAKKAERKAGKAANESAAKKAKTDKKPVKKNVARGSKNKKAGNSGGKAVVKAATVSAASQAPVKPIKD
jgi:hypothetical protein